MGRRSEHDLKQALRQIPASRKALDQEELQIVRQLRTYGTKWETIGYLLDSNSNAVRHRLGRKLREGQS